MSTPVTFRPRVDKIAMSTPCPPLSTPTTFNHLREFMSIVMMSTHSPWGGQ